MASPKIYIAKDFSKFPAGRFVGDGPFSGQQFRRSLLVPALKEHVSVEVNLDGTLGFGSSFLEEAFGGLVRIEGFTAQFLHTTLKLVCTDDPTLVGEIWSYIDEAVAGDADDVR